jgi:LysR family transcriptional regulator, glycine cleavage system transcriptional activator
MRKLPSMTSIRFFEEVAKHASFKDAANSLCVTQGAVSRQIAILEETLGVRLFERNQKGVQLTAQGQGLLPYVATAFDRLEEGVKKLDTVQPRGRLVVSAPPTFASRWLAPRLGSVACSLPNVIISIRIDAAPEADCTILFGAKPDKAEPYELLMQEQHILVGAPAFQGTDLRELLLTQRKIHVLDGRRRLDLWPNWLQKSCIHDTDTEDGFEFSTLDQAIQAVRQGVGLAIVDVNMISEELVNGSIVGLSEIEVFGPLGYWIKLADQSKATRHCLSFQQWLKEAMVSHVGL